MDFTSVDTEHSSAGWEWMSCSEQKYLMLRNMPLQEG